MTPHAKPVVNIYFNGTGCFFPPGAAWEKFRGLDAARTFEICAESWERNGWEVRRFSTVEGDFEPTPFLDDGEVSKSWGWYHPQHWQFCAKAKAISREHGSQWFATMDVINFGFKLDGIVHRFPPVTGGQGGVVNGSSFQREHFSMALLCCNRDWFDEAERILMRYDRGELPALNRDYTSDETILRNYPPAHTWNKAALMTFANNTERGEFPLCHFSRSAVPSRYATIPLSV